MHDLPKQRLTSIFLIDYYVVRTLQTITHITHRRHSLQLINIITTKTSISADSYWKPMNTKKPCQKAGLFIKEYFKLTFDDPQRFDCILLRYDDIVNAGRIVVAQSDCCDIGCSNFANIK